MKKRKTEPRSSQQRVVSLRPDEIDSIIRVVENRAIEGERMASLEDRGSHARRKLLRASSKNRLRAMEIREQADDKSSHAGTGRSD